MNTKEIINAVAKEIEDKGGIRQVFLVACGGSLVDMYPAKYFLDSEATKAFMSACIPPMSLSTRRRKR